MKILVTGAAGFIGANFCLWANKKGLPLIAIDNLSNPFSRKRLLLLQAAKIPFFRHNTRNLLPEKIKRGITAIVHLASHCSTPRSFTDPKADFLDNALGTLNVLEFARAIKPRPLFIYASTIKVYPDSLNLLPKMELPLRYAFKKILTVPATYPVEGGSHSPYGCSKYAGDLYCQEYGRSFGLPVFINRLSTVYGPYQYGTEEAGWIYHFIIAAKKKIAVNIYGNGKQVRDPLWVTDLCELFFKQINSIAKNGVKIYNVGAGPKNILSLLELVGFLNQASAARMKINFLPKRRGDLDIFVSNISPLYSDFKWQPKTPIWKGIKELFKLL